MSDGEYERMKKAIAVYGESWRAYPPAYRAAHPIVPRRLLEEAHLFLSSIASADAKGEQGAWMIQQAREGLRRSGGRDFDAEHSTVTPGEE